MVFSLAACNGGTPPAQTQTDTSVVQWDRTVSTIVFRADVTGGSQSSNFLARSEIPACTLYGDNHLVWTNELGPFNVQVLEDRLSDEQVVSFVNYLALNEQIYKYKAEQQAASSTSPVVETLTLFVNSVNHVTDAFSGWDVSYYQRILEYCQRISEAPVLYVPTGAWISVQAVPYDTSAPGLLWDAAANNLKLADLAASGERKWITDRNLGVIWNIIRSSPPNIQFNEDSLQYQVALEIPNITRTSPAAP